MTRLILFFFSKFYFILRGEVARAEGGYKGMGKMNRVEMYDLKVAKNKLKMHLQIELHYLRHIIYFNIYRLYNEHHNQI